MRNFRISNAWSPSPRWVHRQMRQAVAQLQADPLQQLRPPAVVRGGDGDPKEVEKQVLRALVSAQKYSLVANSVKSRVSIEPEIIIVAATPRR